MKLSWILPALLIPTLTTAAPKPGHRHEAGGNKTGRYITEGFFSGGERNITQAKLKDIRRAKSNEGYERVVLDLEGGGGDGDGIPYFQIQASPEEGRLVLSLWADVQYDFDASRIHKAFTKSAHVKRLNILPRVEEGLSIVEFVLQPPKTGGRVRVEAFRLANPARIIMDLI